MAGNGGNAGRGMARGVRTEASAGNGLLVLCLQHLLWIAWGWHAQAYALIALQIGLFALNIRGLKKTAPGSS